MSVPPFGLDPEPSMCIMAANMAGNTHNREALLGGSILLFLTFSAPAAVLYVDLNCAAPSSPYTNWSTAARDIQSAVDVAVAGDTVLVTNGAYVSGGRTVNGYALTNRVVINKAITVQSINGPLATIIQGYQVPGAINDDSAVRGVYMTNNATLIGFTVMNGATLVTVTNDETRPGTDPGHEGSGGGLWCESSSAVVSNCVVTSNWACVYGGGGVYGGTLNNCTLTANWAAANFGMGIGGRGAGAYLATLNNCLLATNVAFGGGAAWYCTLSNCTVTGNSAWNAGGVASCTLDNCTLMGNWANQNCGGAFYGTLNNCTLTGNWSYNGGGAYSATLNNCTLTGNRAVWNGGGVYSSTLNNCTLAGNSAGTGAGAFSSTLNNCTLTGNSAIMGGGAGEAPGGGAYSSTLINCTVAGNWATYGGGAFLGALYNCIVTNNSAMRGGGAHSATLNNSTLTGNSAYDVGGGVNSSTLSSCIVYFNSAGAGGPNYTNSALNYCCTTPLPSGGVGNITNAPAFLDYAGGNLRLQSNSPCINAGDNAYAPGSTDLDGNPRIVGGTVDIGAYELQSPASIISYAWLQQYGLPTDGSADYADSDHDGMNNWQEWLAGTDPTNPASVLRLQPLVVASPGLRLRWSSDTNHAYFVQRATSLEGPLRFSVLRANIPGLPGATAYTDTTAPSMRAAFYRVGTDSTNGSSPLSLQLPVLVPASVTLTWSSVTNRCYSLERRSLGVSPTFSLVCSNIAGQAGTTTFTDTNALGAAPRFYRVRVEQE